MRHEIIEFPDDTIAIAYPVRRAKVSLLDSLIRKLYAAWLEYSGNTIKLAQGSSWVYVEAICSLIPSEKRFPFTAERFKELLFAGYIDFFEEWFLVNGDEPSKLIQMHTNQFRRPEKYKEESAGPTFADVPFPSSGNTDCDTLANLITAFGVDGGFKIYGALDTESIDRFLYTWSELQRSPDDRLQEYINERDRKILDQNREILNNALGLPSYFDMDF